jgi:hypothetical protein
MYLPILLLHHPHFLIPHRHRYPLPRLGALCLCFVMPHIGLVIPISSGYNRQISSLEVVITTQYVLVAIHGLGQG